LAVNEDVPADLSPDKMTCAAAPMVKGHAQIQTTMVYLQLTPQDVRDQYVRAVAQLIRPTPPSQL